MDTEKQEIKKSTFTYFSTFRRIALVIFIAFSIFMTVSTIILIFLTKPSRDVKMVDVVGKRLIDVHNSLTRKGLRIDIKFIDVFDIDDGLILSQYPEAGKVVNENSTLKVVVSRSKINIETPNLVGIELPVAINKLKNLHSLGKAVSIPPGIISYIPSENKADNIVLGQNPRAGEIITPDRKINLLVSAGNIKNDNAMPGVTGQSIDLAYDLLASKGVVIREEIVETADIKQSGIILSQAPQKGSLLKNGDIAVIRVMWHAIKEHPFTAYEKVEYIIPGDQKPGLYEALVDDSMSKRIRFSGNMRPGEKIVFIFQRVGVAKIIFTNDKKTIRILSIDVEDF